MIWASLNIIFVGLVTFCLQLIRVLFRRKKGNSIQKNLIWLSNLFPQMVENQGKRKDTVLHPWNYSACSGKHIYDKPHQTPDCCFQSLGIGVFCMKKKMLARFQIVLGILSMKEHAVFLSILYQMLEEKSFQFRKRWKYKHKNNSTKLYRLFALNKIDDGGVWPFVQKGSPEMGKNPKLFAKFHNQWCDNLNFCRDVHLFFFLERTYYGANFR